MKASKPQVRLLVLDILKPHKPNILEFGKILSEEDSVENADITVYALDEKTESLKITLEGTDMDFDKVKQLVESCGGVVHSMDKVILSKRKKSSD